MFEPRPFEAGHNNLDSRLLSHRNFTRTTLLTKYIEEKAKEVLHPAEAGLTFTCSLCERGR